VVPNSERPCEVKRTRRSQTGVRTLIVLVACCAVIFWAGRVVWEYRDPVLADSRAIQARALSALQAPRATERVAAIRELERLHFAESALAIPSLTTILRDANSEVRIASAEALGGFGSRAVQSGSDHDAVRAAVTALIGLLKDPQPGVRIAAAKTIGSMTAAIPGIGGGPPVGPPPPGGKKLARVPAVTATTPIDTAAVIAALAEALGDQEAKVRSAAIVALAAIASTVDPPKALAVALKDESAENRGLTVRMLAEFQLGLDPWLQSLLWIAEHDDDPSVRAMSVYALNSRIRPPAVTAAAVGLLVPGLECRDAQVSVAVAPLLGRLGPDAVAAIPHLLCVLTEPKPIDEERARFGNDRQNLAWEAASALGRIAPGSASTEEVVKALTEVARAGPRTSQAAAASALSDFGPFAASAIPVLIQIVREAGPTHNVNEGIILWNRLASREEAAARTLSLIAPDTPTADEAVSGLVALLRSERAPNRAAALKALPPFGPKAAIAVPKIRELCEDPNLFVRQAAASALAVLDDESKP
jgi:HEAT repeat protein